MYSAQDGHLTDFHLAHLGAFSYRGASLTIIEATAVLDNGGITPQDSGLWKDSQIEPIRRIATFVHSQGQKLGIQLAHAGRKASTVAPWLLERGASRLATKEEGGWTERVWGASPIVWGEGYAVPKEMTKQDIAEVVNGFRDSAKRAIQAGVDVIEIHAAHGYLLSSFLSPISNRRSDEYGGSFENRTRILVEVIQAIRQVIPQGTPLLVRVSATEWMEGTTEESWTVESTIKLAKLLPALGVDLLDVSSGGNNEKQKLSPFNDRQISIAHRVRTELIKAGVSDLLIGAVGMITEAEQAKEILEITSEKINEDATHAEVEKEANILAGGEGVEIQDEQGAIAKADVVLVARQFLREPEWVLRVAFRLGVKVQWPVQYSRAQFLKGSRI
jgi:2,4-dienoyl-CoA reductase-like NADH-dependent reductase (Old Yellow Enzyme family)